MVYVVRETVPPSRVLRFSMRAGLRVEGCGFVGFCEVRIHGFGAAGIEGPGASAATAASAN